MCILICTTDCKKTGLVSLGKSCDKKTRLKTPEITHAYFWKPHLTKDRFSNEKPLHRSLPVCHYCKHHGTNHIQVASKHSWDNHCVSLNVREQQCKIHEAKGWVHLHQPRARSIWDETRCKEHSTASNTQMALRAAGSEAQEQPFQAKSTLLPNTQINTMSSVSKTRGLKRTEKELPR